MGKNTSSKLFSAIFLVLAVCFIVGVPSVSAFDWEDDILAYYSFEETSGTNILDNINTQNGTYNGVLLNVDGIIGSGIEFDGVNDFVNLTGLNSTPGSHTFSFWYQYTGGNGAYLFDTGDCPRITLGTWAGTRDYSSIGSHSTFPSGNDTQSAGWHNLIEVFDTINNIKYAYLDGVRSIDNATYAIDTYINGTQSTVLSAHYGLLAFVNYTLDEIGIWEKVLSEAEVAELYNSGEGLAHPDAGIELDITASLYFPPEGVLLSDLGLNFIANYTNSSYNLTNSTYYIWKKDGVVYDIFNTTTTTNFINSTTTQFIDSFTLGKYKWNVLVCGDNATSSLCVWAPSNYTFEIGASIDYESYSNSTYGTTSETFDINISLLSGVILYEANLYYNGTEYLGTITDLGDEKYSITTTIDIPSVNSETNISLYWTFKYDDGGTTAQNSTTHNQTILNLPTIVITDGACAAGMFSSVFYNFSDSENLTALNTNIAYNFKFGIGDLDNYVVNGLLIDKASFRICINNSVDSYKLGYGEIEYGATDYIDRRYYMYEGQLLSNSTQANHTLYLLPTVSSTSFIFEFKNTFLNPYTDKLIALLRWYPEEDEYKVVEMAKADDAGKTVMKVHTEDVDYRVGLYYLNGSLIKLADPVRMACLVDPCTYTLKVIHDPVDFDIIYNIESSLTWDEDNNRFVYVFNDPSQLTSQMRLHVYRDAGFQEILICNDTAIGYTGVLTCDVGNYTGTLIAKVYRSAITEWPIASLYHSIRDGIESSFGLFASFLIVLTSALVGVFSPIGSIFLLLLGLMPALFFGSITFAVFMGIGVLGGIIINIIKNYS